MVDGLVIALDIGFADKAVVAQCGLDLGHGALEAAMTFDMHARRRHGQLVLKQNAQQFDHHRIFGRPKMHDLSVFFTQPMLRGKSIVAATDLSQQPDLARGPMPSQVPDIGIRGEIPTLSADVDECLL